MIEPLKVTDLLQDFDELPFCKLVVKREVPAEVPILILAPGREFFVLA